MKSHWLPKGLLFTTVCLVQPSVAQAASPVVPATSAAEEAHNVQVILNVITALNTRHFEQLTTMMAPSFTYVDPALPAAVSTNDFAAFIQGFVVSFPDLQYTVERIVPRGETVVIFLVATGTFLKAFPYAPGKVAPATNQALSVPLVSVYDLQKGQIVRGQSYWDLAGFLRALAVTP